MISEDDFNAKEILLVFGSNIRKARERNGLTIKSLAENSHYDRVCLSRLEKGDLNIKLSTAVKLARTLDVSFPALFSRNFMETDSDSAINFSGSFNEDDYLLVFREKFSNLRKKYTLLQVAVTDITDVNEQIVSRVVNGAITNPTIETLYALAYTVNGEMYSMFSRT